MKNIVFVILVLWQSSQLLSQVGIGTTTPRASLEIANVQNGGLLIPQYALTGNNDVATVVNPQTGALVDGTLVYNTTAVTGGNALSKGFVFWEATTSTWNPVGATDGGGGATSVYGQVYKAVSTDEIFNSTPISFGTTSLSNGVTISSTTIAIPAGTETGIYRITYSINVEATGGNQDVEFFIAQNNSKIDGSSTFGSLPNNEIKTLTKSFLVDIATTATAQNFTIFSATTDDDVRVLNDSSFAIALVYPD